MFNSIHSVTVNKNVFDFSVIVYNILQDYLPLKKSLSVLRQELLNHNYDKEIIDFIEKFLEDNIDNAKYWNLTSYLIVHDKNMLHIKIESVSQLEFIENYLYNLFKTFDLDNIESLTWSEFSSTEYDQSYSGGVSVVSKYGKI
ncbi:MAG: hypothetical protein KatS3mg002_0393 [Candidatus Woesearchaeota archaeon]|nr:MAG: hypothetical protein KatS3mg002_0393 [Candidatus Woesearchaeota archaeon]